MSKAPNPQLLRGPCHEVGDTPVSNTILLFCNKSIKQFGIFPLILTNFKVNTHGLFLFMFKTDYIYSARVCVCVGEYFLI